MELRYYVCETGTSVYELFPEKKKSKFSAFSTFTENSFSRNLLKKSFSGTYGNKLSSYWGSRKYQENRVQLAADTYIGLAFSSANTPCWVTHKDPDLKPVQFGSWNNRGKVWVC